jgi:DnaJ-class molecular chaperone
MEEGYTECDKCEGSGYQKSNYKSNNECGYSKLCTKCRGDGKLDWVEAVVGKRPYNLDFITDIDITSLYAHNINPIISASQGTGKSMFLDYPDLIKPEG